MESTYHKKELNCYNGSKKIFGVAYIPDNLTKPVPTLIHCHGYGTNSDTFTLTRLVKSGIAVYSFDFCGGSICSRSDGDSIDMSPITEVNDLNIVIDTLKHQHFVDNHNLFLCGFSQGGYVSTIVAANRPEEIRGLILMNPAYILNDYKYQYASIKDVPETLYMGMPLSSKYITDIFNIDIYDVMKDYPHSVLIFHGSSDYIVPHKYCVRAREVFPSAKLITVQGAGHMFGLKYEDKIIQQIVNYINGQKHK